MTNLFFPVLQQYIDSLPAQFDDIPQQRRQLLQPLADYIRKKRQAGEPIRLIVICTHNSRRSHMGQLWLQAAARYYGIADLTTFSGGTEATAFNPRAIAAMQRAGFEVTQKTTGDNPTYWVRMYPDDEGQLLFSKKYDEMPNPTEDFAAVMVCSEADAGCPFVPGAELRVAIPFDDPKDFDGTPEEMLAYSERCRQMACAFFYGVHFSRE